MSEIKVPRYLLSWPLFMAEIWSDIQTDNRCHSPLFPQAVCFWLALTLIHILLLGKILWLCSRLFHSLFDTLPLAVSISLRFLSDSVSVPPANLSSGQARCPSSVRLVPMPDPLCPQVLVWMQSHPSTPQTDSQLIKIREEMSVTKMVAWPDPVIWYQRFLECMYELRFKVKNRLLSPICFCRAFTQSLQTTLTGSK